MKHKALLLFFLVCAPMFLYAQVNSYWGLVGSKYLYPGDPASLVRYCGGDRFLLYEKKDSAYFTVADMNGFVSGTTITPSITNIEPPAAVAEVMDMQVSSNIAFFCGESTSGHGIIGFCNLSSSIGVSISFGMAEIIEVSYLSKLTVYRDSVGGYRIFSIGHNSALDQDFIIEMVNMPVGPAPFNYKYVQMIEHELRWDDVSHTDDMIVLAGRDVTTEQICIMKLDPYTGVNSSMMNFIYRMPLPEYHTTQPIHSCAIRKNLFAILFRDGAQQRVVTVDCGIPHFGLVTLQEFDIDPLEENYTDITYSDSADRLTLLSPRIGFDNHIIMLPTIPSEYSYYAPDLHTGRFSAYSLTDIEGIGFAVWGSPALFLQRTASYPNYISCFQAEWKVVNRLNPQGVLQHPYAYKLYQNQSFSLGNGNITIQTINRQCELD